ncbi:calcium-binding protein [Parapusillimonas granuli]|uniref:Calcium-binding protein n=1 Tax=Parapusillimonas granuli TaxID=380911 RepID=A0A853FZZ0_9BURK|nr:Ca2+-binding RTX toxin-like protein [Parapusillimonas granuli]NYT49619.1 calcium-binding protein [Parapusillimonas granuli]
MFLGDQVAQGGLLRDSLNNTDMLDGAGGHNKLIATVTANVTPASLANIQDIQVTNAGVGLSTVTLTNAGQVEKLSTAGNTNAITFNNVQTALKELSISNNTTDVSVNTVAAALAGAADVLNVNLASVTNGALSATVATGTNGYETIAINSDGAVANTLASVAGATSTNTLKVAGSQNLTVTTSLAATVRTINAADFAGNLNVTHTNAAQLNITGGKGNDTFILGNTFVGAENATAANRDVINGGEGRDTLSIASAQATAASAAAQTTVTNIERILVSDAVAGNIDLTKFASADTLAFGNATIGAHIFTLGNGNTVEFVTGVAGNSARAFQIEGVGTTDALTLKAVAGTDFGTSAQSFNGIEQLTIDTGTAAAGTVTFGGAVTLTPTAGGTGKIVATGGNNLTLAGTVTADEIDASGLSGTAALDMTGGGLAGAGKVTGGAGNDTIIGSAGNDVLVGGAGNNNISGGAGNDVIIGGTGNDIITGGAGVDVMTGGAGANVFAFASGSLGATPTASNFDTITDWAAGTGNRIDFGATAITVDAGTGTGLTVNAKGLVTAGAADLNAFVTALGNSSTTAAGSAIVYSNGTDSYLFISDGTAGLGANDTFVKLTGVNATDGLTLNAGDIVGIA